MTAKWTMLAVLAVCAAPSGGFAQAPPATILEIDSENTVFYVNDVSDYSKLATNPSATPVTLPKNFHSFIGISDIVAVNGQPAKGTWVVRATAITLRPQPTPGQAIADTTRNIIVDQVFEIMQADGTTIGNIMASGFGGLGPPPPGAPSSAIGANFAITGGTGAFLGSRGQVEFVQFPAGRNASVTEDPANRRTNGGGRQRFVLHVIPMSTPEVLTTASGPAVVHSSDFTLVSAAKPASAGEILTLFAHGLGPLRMTVDPGKPFPANPPAAANSPVVVSLNGQSAEVLYAGGYPGSPDGYQVNFRVPGGLPPGLATLRISAAWVIGSEVTLAVK